MKLGISIRIVGYLRINKQQRMQKNRKKIYIGVQILNEGSCGHHLDAMIFLNFGIEYIY